MGARYIPEELKQAVRQACCFGCVVCGLPIYHYDHIEDFVVVQEHTAENLALLCPTHHQDKTSGRLTAAVVTACRIQPANAKRNHTTPHLHLAVGDRARFVLGGVVYESSFALIGNRFEAIRLYGQTMLGVTHEAGNLLFDICLMDESGRVILLIDKGELMISTGVWDYRVEGKDLEIRSDQTTVSLRLRFEEHGFSVSKGYIIRSPTTIRIEPDRVVINSDFITNFVQFGGAKNINCRVGLEFG